METLVRENEKQTNGTQAAERFIAPVANVTDRWPSLTADRTLDLRFDSSNAQGIFKMTACA